MTYKEALDIAKSSNGLLHGANPEKKAEYVRIIIDALESKVEVKAIGKSESYHDYDDSGEIFYLECPVCGNRVSISDYDDFEEDLIDNYCSECGQAISKEYLWDGEEEE